MDSFKGFTGQELRVLGGVMSKAARTTVALCADGIEDSSGGYGLFSPVIRTASRLRSLAYERGVPVAKPHPSYRKPEGPQRGPSPVGGGGFRPPVPARARSPPTR